MIKVYLDTNMLEDYSNHNLVISEKILSDKFYNFLNRIKNSSMLYASMKIIIPQVVIDEIKRHIIETYNFIDMEYEKIGSVYRFTNLQLLTQSQEQTVDNFNNELKTLTTNYSIISIEKHKNSIANIYDRAIQKLSPFYKKNPQLDCGFKDAIIWKTAVDNCEDNSMPIICTRDTDLNGCGIELARTFDEVVSIVAKNADLKDEFFISYIKQDYIKKRMADEVGFFDAKKIDVEFLEHSKLTDICDEDNNVVDCVKVRLDIDDNIVIAEFGVDVVANEMQRVFTVDDGEN